MALIGVYPPFPFKPFTPKMSDVIKKKINNTIATLVTHSRVHFETQLAKYQAELYNALCEKEQEMRPQTLDAKFNFNFCVSLPYSTEPGPLFPPVAAVPARRSYYLRRSARKPAGFYSEEE